MKKFLNILMNTVVLFIMSVAISHTASERSGMLACNPNDETQKPVIYAFDGKHLIKDNDPTIPYKHLSSIADQFDVYFAFVPTLTHKMNKQAFDKAKDFAIKNYESIQDLISDIEILCNQKNPDFCVTNAPNSIFLPFGYSFKKTIMKEKDFVENHTNTNISLGKWFDAFGTAEEVVSKLKDNVETLVEKKFSYDLSTDFYHVKLTLDLENMRVIEQSSLRIEEKKTRELFQDFCIC